MDAPPLFFMAFQFTDYPVFVRKVRYPRHDRIILNDQECWEIMDSVFMKQPIAFVYLHSMRY